MRMQCFHNMGGCECASIVDDDRATLLQTIELAAREFVAVVENLTATQQRCNELLEENRALRAQLKDDLQ